MKAYERLLRFSVYLCLLAAVLLGCTAQKPEKVFDPNHDPKLYIEHFDRFVSLYGTERMEVLDSLGYEFSDLEFEHGFHFGLPLEAQVCGVSFDVGIDFDDDAKLRGVTYSKTYSYPTEKELAVEQIMETCNYLADSLGQPDQVDIWNDVLEERSGQELDQPVPIYQSEEQLTELFDNEWGGGIMYWDISGYSEAFDAYNADRVSRGRSVLGFGFNVSVDCMDGIITFSISY